MDDEGNGSLTRGRVDQMEKRIELLESLYVAIDRKLWILIVLAVGAIISRFVHFT